MTDENENELPEFEKNSIIEVHGHQYGVDVVDVMPREDADRVLGYRLEAVDPDAPVGRIEVDRESGTFVYCAYHQVDPDEIVVVEEPGDG